MRSEGEIHNLERHKRFSIHLRSESHRPAPSGSGRLIRIGPKGQARHNHLACYTLQEYRFRSCQILDLDSFGSSGKCEHDGENVFHPLPEAGGHKGPPHKIPSSWSSPSGKGPKRGIAFRPSHPRRLRGVTMPRDPLSPYFPVTPGLGVGVTVGVGRAGGVGVTDWLASRYRVAGRDFTDRNTSKPHHCAGRITNTS